MPTEVAKSTTRFRADTAGKANRLSSPCSGTIEKTVFRVVIRIKTCGRIVVWTTARRATRRALASRLDDSMNARIFNRALESSCLA